MSEENVISLATRKNLTEIRAEKEEAEALYEKTKTEAEEANKAQLLNLVDRIRTMIEKDQIDGLVVAGRCPENGLFFSEITMNGSITRADVHYAYAGVLDMMKMEMLDDATSGPHMDANGEFFGWESGITIEEALELGEDDD